MKIKKMVGTIATIVDLSPTAKDITLTLAEPIEFLPGAFINLFM
ncbi:MAG: hypothetical protein RLZZ76_707, partial [Candidatus Parcubacteria bacterium]